jgi:hypothetical protein
VKEDSVARPRTQDEPEQAADTSAAGGEQSAQAGDGTSYTVERLLAESDVILGQPAHVVAGALYESEPSEEMSVSTAKQKVEEFLGSSASTPSESDETQA